MNQILVTKKLYITPELKKKKKIYKFDFILSLFLVCILVSFYIYAEYDRTKSEEVSQTILANMNTQEDNEDTTVAQNNVLVVVFNDQEEQKQDVTKQPAMTSKENDKKQKEVYTTANGYRYTSIASISIPKINVIYPILEGETSTLEETEALLKNSPTKFWGPDPNEVGNFCIVGHNYRNSRFFSKVPTLQIGDQIQLTTDKTLTYEVYEKYTVDPSDVSCTSQKTNGKREVTLITCTDDSKLRVIVKCREV
jgi:sortase A